MIRLLSALFIGIVLVIGGLYLVVSEENIKLFSPTPQVFGETAEFQLENDWFLDEVENKDDAQLYISAKSALVADYDSGEILFAKNANARLPAASTIKIMTALVALENASLDSEFTVSEKAAAVGENSMLLSTGEKLTLEELLYGLMLVSGNDAAITIAEGVAGSEEAFVGLMNNKAKRLGLEDTFFINSNGLDVDGKSQYSTVRDMVTLARYTWENFPEFREIVSTFEKRIETNLDHKEFILYNDTNLLTTYPGVRGIKPGFTWDAGWCLVTLAENDGKKLLGVILGSEDRRGEMVLLLDYGFRKFGINVEHPGLDL